MKYFPIKIDDPLFGADMPNTIDDPLDVPENLQKPFKQSFSVKRYVYAGYPDGVFDDNTGNHTLRVRKLARSRIFSSVIDKNLIDQYLLLHDIPEVGFENDKNFDMSAVAKEADKQAKTDLSNAEMETAKKLFTPDQLKLYQQFNAAAAFLDDELDYSELIPVEAILARIIDQADGNAFFHFIWSIWAESDDYDTKFRMPQPAVDFTPNQIERFRSRVMTMDKRDARYEATKILTDETSFVRECWQTLFDKLEGKKIPPEIIESDFFGIKPLK